MREVRDAHSSADLADNITARERRGIALVNVCKTRRISGLSNLKTDDKRRMTDAQRVQDLQRKIYRKAKQDKQFRFYILYDKVSLAHFLREAYKKCKANKGRAGVDGVSFADIERGGVEVFLDGIAEQIKTKTYKPDMVLRLEIPKANGKTRPLGIPAIKDRVVQMAVKFIIEPIFEADFEDSSYGFRPKRSAGDAVAAIKENLKDGKTEVFDADLSSYFDTIPHTELMALVAQRISDKNMLHLIKMWLKAPVFKDGRPAGGKKNKVGTPQGSVISPLLANIYLHLFDKAVCKQGGIFQANVVKIIRYADDFVLMAKTIPPECYRHMSKMFELMKLSLNTEKSHSLNATEEPFEFLGFVFRYDKDLYGRGQKYWNVEPSQKSQKKARANIREYLRRNGHKPPEEVVKGLNAIIRGWLNYFTIERTSYSGKAKRNMRKYLFGKLSRFYKRKSQRPSKLYNQGAFDVLVRKYGLIDPTKYACTATTVKA